MNQPRVIAMSRTATSAIDVEKREVQDHLLDVPVDDSPLFDRPDDGSQVVVGSNHLRGFFRDFGTGDAHSHPDIRLHKCVGVVDAIAGHRHDLTTART